MYQDDSQYKCDDELTTVDTSFPGKQSFKHTLFLYNSGP